MPILLRPPPHKRPGKNLQSQPYVIITRTSFVNSSVQAAVAGTVVVAEGFLNRDTRDTLTVAEQSYLHDSFKYTGGGLALTALAARSMFRSGVAFRIMSANPCAYSWFRPCQNFMVMMSLCLTGLVLGVSLVGSIGSMMGVYYTPPDRTVQKHLFWLASH